MLPAVKEKELSPELLRELNPLLPEEIATFPVTVRDTKVIFVGPPNIISAITQTEEGEMPRISVKEHVKRWDAPAIFVDVKGLVSEDDMVSVEIPMCQEGQGVDGVLCHFSPSSEAPSMVMDIERPSDAFPSCSIVFVGCGPEGVTAVNVV